MMTLQYDSLAALGEWVKVVTLTTSHSKGVVDLALRGQLFLDELRRNTWAGRQFGTKNGGFSC